MSVAVELVLSPVTGQGEEDGDVHVVAELHKLVARVVEDREEVVTEQPGVAESDSRHLLRKMFNI